MCQGGNKSSCVPNTVDLSSVWTFELQPLFAFVFYLTFYSAFSSSLCWNMHLYIVCDIWPLSDSSTSVTVWPKHVTQTELKLNWQCVVMVSLGPADSSAIKDTTKICFLFLEQCIIMCGGSWVLETRQAEVSPATRANTAFNNTKKRN